MQKVVVVTGGSSGIGKGIAKKFAEKGFHVVIFGRDFQKLKAVQKEISGNVLSIQGDVTNTQDLKKLYMQTKSHFGKIDVLIANAGVAKRVPLPEITEEEFDYQANINYRGLFFTVRHALDFLNRPASVILLSSIAAHSTRKNNSIYSSTKAAVFKLAQNFAFDLAEQMIRVNSISPGYIQTPIFDERIKKDSNYLASREQYIPLKRIGTPEDVANAAFFLSSDEASYITGVDLIVDGGLSASYPLVD